MRDLRNRVAVVTGAAGGLGLGLAVRLVEAGAQVVMADIDETALEVAAERVARLGPAIGVRTDVSDVESVEALRLRTEEIFGPAQLVINNAGVITPPTSVEDLSLSSWEWVLGVNLWGPIHGCRTFLPGMLERGQGHLVNVSSGVVLRPRSMLAPYLTSKHGVIGLSTAIYYDLEERAVPVQVSVVVLGGVETDLDLSSRRNFLDRFGDNPFTPSASEWKMPPRMDPLDAAAEVLDGIRSGSFWISAGSIPGTPQEWIDLPRQPPFG
jgi:NAD(P)-dependent dehydrogenase (short-subunit alcohol dehydrogenase family)